MTDMDDNIIHSVKTKISEQIDFTPRGLGCWFVETPFAFADGDHYVILLKEQNGAWRLTDEGHTLMHLSYWIDEKAMRQGTRDRLIRDALSYHGLEEDDGELFIQLDSNQIAEGLYSYLQALMKITDVTYLSRERVRSTFYEDFRQAISDMVASDIRVFNWNDASRDPNKNYIVDCYIEGAKYPLLVFALPTNSKVKDATITLLTMESWGIEHRAMGIFENQEEITRKDIARFSEVADKQIPSLDENNIDRIGSFITRELAVA